jgi:pimeloyl-ACP methyl ester carboxylesterase
LTYFDEVEVPEWFTTALDVVPDEGDVEVDGASIHYRAWGPAGQPGVVLVHGAAAHSRWWDHIGPLLADDRRIVAIDLSGHGDSAHREDYDVDQWADEVLAVAAAGGIEGRPILIGHSMGGLVVLRAAAEHGPELLGAVAVDSPVRAATQEEREAHNYRSVGGIRVYSTREDAVMRFRTMPDQVTLPYVKEHIAETSVEQVEGGWSWKFDALAFERNPAIIDKVRPVNCPTILMPAEYGLLLGDDRGHVVDRDGHEVPVVQIPGAAHHVMLDSPIALITGLRTLIAAWPPSFYRPSARDSGNPS